MPYAQPAPHAKIHQTINVEGAVNRHNLLITSTACRQYPNLGLQPSTEVDAEWNCLEKIARHQAIQEAIPYIQLAANFIAQRTVIRWYNSIKCQPSIDIAVSLFKSGLFKDAFSNFASSVTETPTLAALKSGIAASQTSSAIFNALVPHIESFNYHIGSELHAKLVAALSSCPPSIWHDTGKIAEVVNDVCVLPTGNLREKYKLKGADQEPAPQR